MTCREFNPHTTAFNNTIRVERTERATILAVPRSLEDFTHDRKPSLLGRLAGMLSLA
ncbi:hypothetical protein [Corynebacterium comes]|uniref:Uncharacterized protein n=1 Tax=Corynebacterium comes TaxID=2675218 RepID=A0A6B8VK61_9CORY|nr:hypothetical protein [Corynebacterium comes]QGU05782.1 hypothetical protein CETAM_12785 [Corynebacterium comes]